ncbi:CAP domain-containing protein [Sulfitobacter sp.]|uniref:CAP domain-containing protein n=1 Tax=Sulfitobacter sp. TaxID=1903071 RepID=UPI003EF278D2
MMRLLFTLMMGLTFAACGGPSSAPLAQQSQTAGVSATTTVNRIRGRAGVSGVKRSGVLNAVAQAHAADMASNNFFGHTGSNGLTVAQRVKRAGYKWCVVSENVAKGYKSRARAIETWRTSKGHYQNIVNGKAREFGLAQAGDYWVMVLAAKRC